MQREFASWDERPAEARNSREACWVEPAEPLGGTAPDARKEPDKLTLTAATRRYDAALSELTKAHLLLSPPLTATYYSLNNNEVESNLFRPMHLRGL